MKVTNLKTGTRVILGCIMILLIGFTIEIISMDKLSNIAALSEKMYNHPLTVSQALLRTRINISVIENEIDHLIETKDKYDIEKTITAIQRLNQESITDLQLLYSNFLGEKIIIEDLRNDYFELFDNINQIQEAVISADNENEIQRLYKESKHHITDFIAHMPYISDFATEKASQFYTETQQKYKSSSNSLFIFIILGGAVSLLIALLITYTINNPLNKIVKWVESVAKGEIGNEINIFRRDEIGKLADTMRQMQINLALKADIAVQVAENNFSQKVIPAGNSDIVAFSINKIIDNFTKTRDENVRSAFLRNGQNELNELLRGVDSIDILSKKTLSFLCTYLDMKLGLFYIYNNNSKTLHRTAAYALNNEEESRKTIKKGEGLAGQVLIEKRILSITDLPEDYFLIQSAAGSTIPRTAAAVPLLYNKKIRGVIEFASLTELNSDTVEFLNSISSTLAIIINSIEDKTQVEFLLKDSQTQTIRLQTQQEELQQTNEELEEQTKALQESEAELQSQQEELKAANEELEERSKALEKQRDLISDKNTDLETAWKEIDKKAKDLETASKYKSEFLANMSHELRTPLNSIIILSELLSQKKGTNLSEKEQKFADTINSSGNDLLILINEVLDLSKIEAGKMELHLENLELKDICLEMEHSFHHISKENKVKFTIEYKKKRLYPIRSDSVRIKQVLKNLLSNAFKFTEKGTVSLILQPPSRSVIYKNLNPENSFELQVKDSGIGIPQDKVSIIFEAFQQVDGTTSRKYGGTGLGLSISRELINLIGGDISLNSEEGKGTLFSVILPKVFPEQKIQVEFPDKIERSTVSDKKRSPKVINANYDFPDDRNKIEQFDKSLLIIEDDSTFAEVIANNAKERGFKVLYAQDGETGLHFADFYLPSAIILDIGLPGINGWTVMDRLKENKKTRHIPVHFMSAEDKTMEAMRLGAIGYLAKPVTLNDLNESLQNIEKLLDNQMKRVLIIEDNIIQRESIAALMNTQEIFPAEAGTVQEALILLQKQEFDCIILDLGLQDTSGYDFLKKLRDNKITNIPVIIYTGKELTKKEEDQLSKYAESIIIKGARSPDRLIDETTLFLHKVGRDLPGKTQPKSRHDEAVFSGKKILVADDDIRNVFALTSILEEQKITVFTAKDGAEALEKVKEENDINAILIDIMMPVMDGFTAIQEIRKIDHFKTIPIIALTAKAMRGDRKKCIDAGATDYMSKPVDVDKLLSLLRVWLH